MAAIRRAESTWHGDLTSGSGVVTAATSHAFTELPGTWASRTESADGRTSPEELVAAAHAACFSMAFSSDLAKAGTPPTRLDVSATVTFDKLDKWTVVSSALAVRGVGPGIDAAKVSVAAREQLAQQLDDSAFPMTLNRGEAHAQEVEFKVRSPPDDLEVVVE